MTEEEQARLGTGVAQAAKQVGDQGNIALLLWLVTLAAGVGLLVWSGLNAAAAARIAPLWPFAACWVLALGWQSKHLADQRTELIRAATLLQASERGAALVAR